MGVRKRPRHRAVSSEQPSAHRSSVAAPGSQFLNAAAGLASRRSRGPPPGHAGKFTLCGRVGCRGGHAVCHDDHGAGRADRRANHADHAGCLDADDGLFYSFRCEPPGATAAGPGEYHADQSECPAGHDAGPFGPHEGLVGRRAVRHFGPAQTPIPTLQTSPNL